MTVKNIGTEEGHQIQLSFCSQVKIWFQNRRSKFKKINKGQGGAGCKGGKGHDAHEGTPDSEDGDCGGQSPPQSPGSPSPVNNCSPAPLAQSGHQGMMQQNGPVSNGSNDPSMQGCSPPHGPPQGHYTPPMATWDMVNETKPSPFAMANGAAMNIPGGYPNFIHHQQHLGHPVNGAYWYPSESMGHQAKWPTA